MTEKLLTSPLPPPSPTSPDPGDGVNRSKFNFFQNSINTNQQGLNARIQEFFVKGGGGVQAPQLILQFTEGVLWFYYTFSRGGGWSNLFQGGGVQNADFYRNPYNYNL